MKAKFFLTFAIFGAALASAKTYEITLNSPSKAGNIELKRGRYGVAVDASKVRFVEAGSGKSMETTGTVVSSEKKFKNTMVNTKEVNGTNQISDIELGGTNTKIQFE